MIDPWPFVIAAYGAVALGSAGLAFWAWRAMRNAEASAEALRKKP